MKISNTFGMALVSAFLIAAAPLPNNNAAHAQTASFETVTIAPYQESNIAEYVSATHLAYIASDRSAINQDVEDGLSTLAQTLNERTSINPPGVVQLNLATDDLSLFPLIYWPITFGADDVSDDEYTKLRNYVRSGGLLVMDRFDGDFAPGGDSEMNAILARLNTGALQPINYTHPIAQSHYLVLPDDDQLPEGELWVQRQSTRNVGAVEMVSSVIVTSGGWARSWGAIDVPSQSRDRKSVV